MQTIGAPFVIGAAGLYVLSWFVAGEVIHNKYIYDERMFVAAIIGTAASAVLWALMRSLSRR